MHISVPFSLNSGISRGWSGWTTGDHSGNLPASLSSEYGTRKTVKARFCPWLKEKKCSIFLSCSLFARKRVRAITSDRSEAPDDDKTMTHLGPALCRSDERGWNNLDGVKNFRTENSPSQDQSLALIGVSVPSSLDSGSGGRTTSDHGESPDDDQPVIHLLEKGLGFGVSGLGVGV